MDRYTRIQAINKVLKEYFEDNPNQSPIPAKEFMGLFIKKGIFNKDCRGGLPIRKLLRARIDFQIFPMLSEKRRR